MDKNIKANVSDQAVKGALLGGLGYLANKWGVSAEVVALPLLGFQPRSATRTQQRFFRLLQQSLMLRQKARKRLNASNLIQVSVVFLIGSGGFCCITD